MRHLEITVGKATGEAEFISEVDSKVIDAICSVLPCEGTLIPAIWSGSLGALQLPPGLPLDELQASVCSLYPGTLAISPRTGELLLSYGAAETRTELGVEYVCRIATVTTGRGSLITECATMHDRGALGATIAIGN